MEEAVVPLGGGTRLHVLIEESKDEDGEIAVGSNGRPHLLAHHHLDQIPVVLARIVAVGTNLLRIAVGGPPRLGDDNGDFLVADADGVKGVVDGVNLGEEHVVVVEIGARVGEALVWLEEDEVEGDVFGVTLVGEERVGVDEDWGARLDVEVQDGSEGSQEVVSEGCGGRRVRYVKDG